MNELLKTIGKIFFYIFILAVAGWTASLTLAEVRVILPNDAVTPWFALALFDGGALVWLLAFTGHAKGIPQRAVALLLLVMDLVGVIVLSAGRLMTGGQQLIEVSQTMGANMVYALIVATVINLVAIYAFHIADPDTMEAIDFQTLDDKIKQEALKQAKVNIEGEVQQLGAILAARATGRLKYNLRLPMNDGEVSQVLEGEVVQAAAPIGVPAWMLNFGRKKSKVEDSVIGREQTSAPNEVTSAKGEGVFTEGGTSVE